MTVKIRAKARIAQTVENAMTRNARERGPSPSA
jgi:hypothetical protein